MPPQQTPPPQAPQPPQYPTQPTLPSQGQTPFPLMPSTIPRGTMPKKAFNWVIIPAVLFALLFLGMSIWANGINGQKNDYKNNVDKKVASAVDTAKQRVSDEKEKEFLEREKNPYRQYRGPDSSGSLEIVYPKTWSAFMTENNTGSNLIDGYMHPSYVPGTNSKTAYALRIQVAGRQYNQILAGYESETKQGRVRVTPFSASKVPGVLGARVDGEIEKGLNGSMVLFRLRDKTIQVSTQSQQFIGDFNNIILPNLQFVP